MIIIGEAYQRPENVLLMESPTSKNLEDSVPPKRCQSFKSKFVKIAKIDQLNADQQEVQKTKNILLQFFTSSDRSSYSDTV